MKKNTYTVEDLLFDVDMRSIMPTKILELEELFDKIRDLKCIEFNATFQEIFEMSTDDLETKSISNEDLIATFLSGLLKYIRWEYLIKKNIELAKEFSLKLANVIIEYGGYRTISNRSYEEPSLIFWIIYTRLHNKDNALKFLKKITDEIKSVEESKDEVKIYNLLSKTPGIFKFFNLTTFDETKETIKELEKAVVTLLNLCTKYKYKLDCLTLEQRTPLTTIFGMVQSKETKNLIIKYLIEYADYFTGLKMDNRECVINTVYPGEDEKSEVFRMYLENALLLNRSDLYGGEILDKVLNKLFREITAERNGENYFFGEDSPEDFSKALLVIEEICNNPDNLKMLLDSDFFNKIFQMFEFFTSKYFREKNPNLESDYFNQIENKMKQSFLKLCVVTKKHPIRPKYSRNIAFKEPILKINFIFKSR